SIDGGTTYVGNQTYQLSSTPQKFAYNINQTGPVKIRFTLVKMIDVTGTWIAIDDLTIFSLIGDKTLIEIIPTEIDDYPETDEQALASLKSEFQSQRNSLPAPLYSIPISNEALLDYY